MAERATRSKGVAANAQNSDAQKAKKRAWDRAAQRKRREKTKTQLDHLEQTIRVLRSGDQAGRITELMAEIRKLRAQNERLRGIMANSAKLLQSAQIGGTDSRDGDDEVGGLSAQDEYASHAVANKGEGNFMTTEPAACASPGSEEPVTAMTDPSLLFEDFFGASSGGEELATTTTESSHPSNDFLNAFELSMPRGPTLYGTTRTAQGQDQESSDGSLTASALIRARASMAPAQSHASFYRFMPNAPLSSSAAWQTANRIFDTIYHVDVFDALAADSIDAGHLLKGIDLGWNVCGRAIERSPTIHMLSQMDKCVWSTLSKIRRAAIAYKSYMLLRYFLNPSQRNLMDMPEWERPIHLQQNTDHPVAINFFPWPAMRRRLILNQEYYFNTSNFFTRVASEFEFRWPYSYEHTFVVERHTGEYRATPLFIDYVRDLRNWTIKERFFDSFPELRSDVCLLDTAMSQETVTVSWS